MPVSDFLWSVETHQQIQNGGIKRKMDGDTAFLELQEQISKRRCTGMSAMGDHRNAGEVDDENHNEMAIQDLNNTLTQGQIMNNAPQYLSTTCSMQTEINMMQGQQQLTCTGFHSQQPHNPFAPVGQTQEMQQLIHHSDQDNMIMDLNDEVYSNSSLSTEENIAQSAMESDFVPNPQQYNVRVFDAQPSVSVSGRCQ